MKVLAVVYPGMTLLDMIGPIQAWSLLPGYEVQYVWRHSGAVRTDCGLSVQATHSFEDAWTDPDVLFVGGGAKPTLDLLGDSAAIAFLADRGSRARWVCSVCTGSLLLGAAGLLRGYRAAVHWAPGKPSANLAPSSAANASASTAIGSPEAASPRASTSASQWPDTGPARTWGESSNCFWNTRHSRPMARAVPNWPTRRVWQPHARCCSRRCRVSPRRVDQAGDGMSIG
jgi:putative intracellular protease/amidase